MMTTCDQNCYTRTQHIQQDQTLTPCTHAYDHITQHINNLEDPTQQHTVYTNEVDALLFTMVPPHHVITILVLIYQI